MECSRSQDSKEPLKSPQSGQANGERRGQRLSQSLRLGELAFEHLHAAWNAVSESSTFVLSASLNLFALYPVHDILFLYG